MKVTIEQHLTPSIFQFPQTTGVELRIYANAPFITYNGQAIPAGNPNTPNSWYLRVPVVVTVVNEVNIPAIEIDSTEDSPTDRSATYTAWLFAGDEPIGNVPFLAGFAVPALIDPQTQLALNQTWTSLTLHRDARNPPPRAGVYDIGQVEYLITAALSLLRMASETQAGMAASSTDPVDPGFPIHISETDPRVITVDQAEALAAADTPSAENPYVTASDISAVAGRAEPPVSVENGDVAVTDARYSASPVLVQLPSGTWLLAYSLSDADSDLAALMVYRTSTDEGKNWSAPTTILNEAGIGYFGPSGGVTPTGRIILFYYRVLIATGAPQSMNYIYSDDEGVTWSAEQVLPTGANVAYSPYGAIVAIGDNKIAMGWYGWTGTYAVNSVHTTYIITSDDDGTTWSAAVAIDSGNYTAGEDFTETSMVYLGGSQILALARVDTATVGTAKQFLSLDNGATWTPQGDLTVNAAVVARGTPPFMVAIENGVGQRQVVLYYSDNGSPKSLWVVYGNAADFMSVGIAAWDALTHKRIVPAVDAPLGTDHVSYPYVVHVNNKPFGFGVARAQTEVNRADLVYVTVDLGVFPSTLQTERLRLNGTSLSTDEVMIDLAAIFNVLTSGDVATAIKLNVVDTFSNAASRLMDLQTGGVRKLAVRKDGRVVSADEFATLLAGGGIIVKTPDGAACYRISVNNAGAVVTALVTCPTI